MAVVIREETPADYEAIANVNRAAFDGDAEAELVDNLRADGDAVVSLVAELDGEVVGHILFSPVTIKEGDAAIRALSLAPMAVLPEYQGQGIGSRLVEAGMAACRELGCEIVVVLGHPGFYPRFGFSSELARRLENPFGDGAAWMASELAAGALDGVAGRIEYAPAFSRLA